MSDDYKVDGLSNDDVRRAAKRARQYLSFANTDLVDVLRLESAETIWTVQGPKPFRLQIVSDVELPNDSGLTTYDGSIILTRIPRRVRHDAFLGHGHARFTYAHELGHATLHLKKLLQGAAMPRRSLGNIRPEWIPKFQSAERQAMVFGAAFLINHETARQLTSADEISVKFGLSREAARIHFAQMQEELARPAAAERMKRIAAEFRASVTRQTRPTTSFLTDPCMSCGQPKLFPVGTKYMCQACDAIYDRYQDGDHVE